MRRCFSSCVLGQSLVLLIAAWFLSPGSLAAQDSLVGKKAGQERSDNGLKMTLVWCPPGNFNMGSPKSEEGRDSNEKQVRVTLTKGFWLGQTEITQGQWETTMGSAPWGGYDIYVKKGSNYPACFVSWEDATAFCKKLTKQEREDGRLMDDWEYTLPTEAQWEYACRAGTTTVYSFGDDASALGDYGWHAGNAWDIDEQYPHTVGSKKPNPWGLLDMHGNVNEWCRDWQADQLPGGRDPEVTVESSRRVFRGGTWFGTRRSCRSASRDHVSNTQWLFTKGFRVALVPSRNQAKR